MSSRDASPVRESENEKVKHTWTIAKQVIYAVWSGRPTIRLLPYDIDQTQCDILTATTPSKIETKRAGFAISVNWADVHPKEPYVAMVGQLRQFLVEIEETILVCPATHFVFVRMDSVQYNKMGHIRFSYRYSNPVLIDNKTIQTPIKEDDFWPPQPI